jgi:hypothetical protein
MGPYLTYLVPAEGIEPSRPAYEARPLPLRISRPMRDEPLSDKLRFSLKFRARASLPRELYQSRCRLMRRGNQPKDLRINPHLDAPDLPSACFAPSAREPAVRNTNGSLRRFFQTDSPKIMLAALFDQRRYIELKTILFLAGNQRPCIAALWALPAERPPYAEGRPA